MPITEKVFVKASKDDCFKAVVQDPEHGKKILEGILSQALKKDVKIVEFVNNELPKRVINEHKKSVDLVALIDGGFINIEVNTNDYTEAKRIRNFNYITSFYSQRIRKKEKYDIYSKFIQINLNYGETDRSYVFKTFYVQSDDHEKYVENFEIVEINVDNLRIACYNQEEREEDYRYILMVDLDKEELKFFYPDDELKKEFEYVLMKVNNEFNWLTPDEDDLLLRNTEKEISFRNGIEQGSDEKTINVIKNAINQSISIETIATLVNLSIDEVKNIIKEHKLDKLNE